MVPEPPNRHDRRATAYGRILSCASVQERSRPDGMPTGIRTSVTGLKGRITQRLCQLHTWRKGGPKLDEVEQFIEAERVWLDTHRALDLEQRELKIAMVMRRPLPRKRLGEDYSGFRH